METPLLCKFLAKIVKQRSCRQFSARTSSLYLHIVANGKRKPDNYGFGGIILERDNCMPVAFMPAEETLSLAMAYVPFQHWSEPYEPAAALSRGTIFAGLDLPFLGEEVSENGR